MDITAEFQLLINEVERNEHIKENKKERANHRDHHELCRSEFQHFPQLFWQSRF